MSSTVSLTFECDNPTWLAVMNSGEPAPEVTGGTIELPQGGTRESRAAVTGGTYTAGSEPASMALDNIMKMAKSLFPKDVQSIVSSKGLDCTSEDISNIADFYTNLAKQELLVTADEYMDNPDEVQATNDVINSIHAVISVDGFSFSNLKEEIMDKIQAVLGGAFA